ncbi:hypothetical protein M5W83_15065 [Paenibacillus thiaminolyticus]|uniref:Uncharacterized protein n=1 Tax=Paenibacillus thiaminolyticus TaxID=49283 RepID=A0AAP9DVC6_PANTH|nr:hypothetical protein [Paenibacillus thiaminolyticus]MCY9534072.1 hypothetical protein [Paenibacillus thiaminolyticus]MCY9600102.1 hypothetical protein [Paenibacillus thiaminolyticus]MCY9608468.1 hypothetical protein [Paenibacillus thiaminolyticus]MCY9615241.1 hypothetical protein [Paenibacillus thiaminolyticus]MCY9620552.1 hypothetical protein [Paenibacillus thiaminolyticus]
MELLVKHDAEYIDFARVDTPDKLMKESGFINRRTYPSLIVPKWYTPSFGGGTNSKIMEERLEPLLKTNGLKGEFTWS